MGSVRPSDFSSCLFRRSAALLISSSYSASSFSFCFSTNEAISFSCWAFWANSSCSRCCWYSSCFFFLSASNASFSAFSSASFFFCFSIASRRAFSAAAFASAIFFSSASLALSWASTAFFWELTCWSLAFSEATSSRCCLSEFSSVFENSDRRASICEANARLFCLSSSWSLISSCWYFSA